MDCCGGFLNACRWLDKQCPGATVAEVVSELCCSHCRGEAPVWIMGQDACLLTDLDGPRVLLVTRETWPRPADALGLGLGLGRYNPFRP